MSNLFGGVARSYRAVMAIAASMIGLGATRQLNSAPLRGRSAAYDDSPQQRPKRPQKIQFEARGTATFGGRRRVKHYAREMARRVRQIETGQLTASNGLISERTGGLKVNSHGRVDTYCRPCARHFEGQDCVFPDCAKVRPNGCAA